MCYYSAFNLPAFIYVLGKAAWDKFRPIFFKLCKFNDLKIQKTLAHSIHELATILGPEITENELVPIMLKFISDKNTFKEARIGALKNLHVFLKEVSPETRKQFLPSILSSNEGA